MNSIQRSVDSLQKIYAVIIALAISQSITKTFSIEDGKIISEDFVRSLPTLVSFFAFVVPFYHGMNRHLDNCYVQKVGKMIQGALLFDFFIFCVESSLLFAFTQTLPQELKGFVLIALMLIVDMFWGFISHWIHYKEYTPSIRRWSVINFITLVIGIVIYSINILDNKPLILMLLSLLRLMADYYFCWRFYFPIEVEEAKSQVNS